MCFGGGGGQQQTTTQPVQQAIATPEELAPEIELASEDNLEIAKKKKDKDGTISLQTDLNIPGNTPQV